MPKVQEPLFYSQVECPICKTTNDYENVKVGSYTESARDTDFCPTGRIWQNPAYQKYDPLLFFMATCKKCFYTQEFNSEFKNWQKDTAFKTYRLKNVQEKHLAEFLKEDGLIKFLGSHLDQGRFPFESAVIKFMLGIYDEKLMERSSKLDLGRYYLRIGWLFRTNGDQLQGATAGTTGFLYKLKNTAAAASQILPNYDARINDLKTLLEHDFAMVFTDMPQAGQLKSQAESVIKEVLLSVTPLKQAGEKLVDLFDQAEKSLACSQDTSDGKYFEYATFSDFLLKAKQLWDGVPLSETEALIKARDYYQSAYESGDKIAAGAGQIQATYLIAELSRRTGNYENANSFFNQVIRTGRDIVNNRKGDASTINYAKKLLETAMEQGRLCRKESEGQAK
jgi:tetratricopeptide (TPR) repeat protein